MSPNTLEASWTKLKVDAPGDCVVEALDAINNPGPTICGTMLKGYVRTDDGSEKFYLSVTDLRNIAAGLLLLAEWLQDNKTPADK